MKDEYEIFSENMDEKTIEIISDDFPVLTDSEKDRIFAEIEKRLGFESDTDDNSDNDGEFFDDTVNGVEKIERSQIVRFAVSAAAFLLIASGIGGGGYLLSNYCKNTPDNPDPEIVEETTAATTQATTTSYTTTIPASTTVRSGISTTTAASTATAAKTTAYATITTVNTSATGTTPVTITSAQQTEPAEEPNSDTETTVADTKDIQTAPVAAETTAAYTKREAETTTSVYKPIETTTVYIEPEEETFDTRTAVTTTATSSENTLPELDKDYCCAVADYLFQDFAELHEITHITLSGTVPDITLRYIPFDRPGDIAELSFSRINSDKYECMDDLKEFYLSVMDYSIGYERVFGPEVSSSDDPANDIYDESQINHTYITYNGELYGKTQDYEAASLVPYDEDFPCLIRNITEDSFTATKKLSQKDALTGAIAVTLDIIYDQEQERWLIDNFSYSYGR